MMHRNPAAKVAKGPLGQVTAPSIGFNMVV